MPTISVIFIWFMIYSFFGWIWEEIVCSIQSKKIVNRGFMSGPYCPIYGFGALMCLGLSHFTTRPIELFFIGGILACILEYATSYLMEKIFKARWWDYSDRLLNINGRVCLVGFCAFGIFAIIIPWLHTYITGFTNLFPQYITNILSIILFFIVLFDFIATTRSMFKLNSALKQYEVALNKNAMVQFLQRSRRSFEMHINEMQNKKHKVLGVNQRRIIRAFPDLDSKYNQALERFRRMNLENIITIKDTKKTKKSLKKNSKKTNYSTKNSSKAKKSS